MADGRKRIWAGWTLVALAAAIVLTRWFEIDIQTGWGTTITIGEGNAWVERDWYPIESADSWIRLHALQSPRLLWRLQEWDTAANATSLSRVDLWIANYQGFKLGNKSVWGMNVLLWPFGIIALGAGVPLIVSGRRVRRRKSEGACQLCGYSLGGLAAGAACPECGKHNVGT